MSATKFTSTNPVDGSVIAEYRSHDPQHVESFLSETVDAQKEWADRSFGGRAELMKEVARLLRRRSDDLATLMAREMGKPLEQGRAEVEKCAWVSEYYADHAEAMLADELRESDHSGAWTVFNPLGVVLAVMPWNFPLWQVLRFAAPTLMAGNAAMLKHASNVSGCALAIESLFVDAGIDGGVFRTLLIPSERVADLITDDRIAAVTLTGSERAGRAVASAAGENLKPSVLELGGSDAYVVLEDADVAKAAKICASSRLTNSGQSCIAAKRFIVVDDVYDTFLSAFIAELTQKKVGDPMDPATDVGPQARADLRDDLHQQVEDSVAAGAVIELGGEIPDGPGAYYPITALTGVEPGMPAFDEELFGPVAAVVRAEDERSAIELANRSRFGLGGAVFTEDDARGRMIASSMMQTGCCFVNAAVASDPRLPFGGIGASGYGRELAELGIRAFMNQKTIAVA